MSGDWMRTVKYQAYLKEDTYLSPEDSLGEGLKIKKGMYNVTGLHFFEGHELTSISIDTEEYGEIQDIVFEYTPFELMQYTGLKDANGKEIYEGDILELPGYHSDLCNKEIPNHLGYVKYVDKQARFNLIYIEDPICWKKDATFLIYAFKQAEKNGGIKKVGTIFENPELLKED